MKSTLTTCVGLLVALFTYANQPASHDSFRCRPVYENIDPSISLAEQLKQDLTSGIWIDETNRDFVKDMITFTPSGHGEWIRESGQQLYQKEQITWNLEEHAGNLYLLLNTSTNQSEAYIVAPNCDGIVLSDLENQIVHRLNYVSPKSTTRLNDLETGLVGKWENILPQVKLKDAGNPEIPVTVLEGVKVLFDFQANGQFRKSIISNGEVTFQESGQWEVSKDGAYIYLQCTNETGQPITQAVKIKHFDLDELVLEQPLAIIGQSYCTDNQYFYFQKI
jgi:hypothetical protein